MCKSLIFYHHLYLFYNWSESAQSESALVAAGYNSTPQLDDDSLGLAEITAVGKWLTVRPCQRHCKKRHVTPLTHSMECEKWGGRGICMEREPGKHPMRSMPCRKASEWWINGLCALIVSPMNIRIMRRGRIWGEMVKDKQRKQEVCSACP